MFWEVFSFELQYRKARTATYVYTGLAFVLPFLTVLSPVLKTAGAEGQTNANAPFVITGLTVLFSFYFTIITSAVMGVVIIRDFEQNTEAILFSTPLKKFDYLMGRFGGSMAVLVLIHFAAVLGLMSAFALGKVVPWEVAWKSKEILPFSSWHYLQPFLLFTLPNILNIGALFFMSGALGRSSIVIYTQGIVLVVLYAIGMTFLRNLETQDLAAVIDPFGVQTFRAYTKYWTPTDQNTTMVALEGVVLYNRLLWTGVGLAALLITYFGFSFNRVRNTRATKKPIASPPIPVFPVPASGTGSPVFNGSTYLQQLGTLSALYFRLTWREVPFLAIVASGVLLLVVNAMKVNSIYGTGSYLTTSAMLTMLNSSFGLFFVIIITFYAGELVWRERSVRFNLIMDTMPIPSVIGLLGKLISLLLVVTSLLLILIVFGVITQALHGYYTFELPVYLGTMFTQTFLSLASYAALAMFVQVMMNNKFLGFVTCIVFLIVNSALGQVGLEHELWRFGSGSLGVFSDMNAYGHFILPFAWLKIYWTAFSLLLLAVAVVFVLRGSDSALRLRWRSGKRRMTRPLVLITLAMGCVFLFSGFFIYYNTTVINEFEPTHDHRSMLASYEKTIKPYESVVQPKITDMNIAVDLYPEDRDFSASGYYYLKNTSAGPITEVHIQQPLDVHLTVRRLEFENGAVLKKNFETFRYSIFQLKETLQPGDSIKMSFSIAYLTEGFEESRATSRIVYNGTFFTNAYFPSLGYNNAFELIERDYRLKHGLREKSGLPSHDDPASRETNIFGDDADRIRFEMVISTSADQIAIAPGDLLKEWSEGNRRFFHYRMTSPMSNFYSVVSARYAVKRDRWKDVNLEIYYHPGHEYNLSRMMAGMKDGLDYYTRNFGPFQHRQIRIIEFPRYALFAQSFANTIPLSEGAGFVLKINNPARDLDMPYYITVRELAKQWWGHQVMEANVKGGPMLSDGLSQYSVLMVMQKNHPQEMMERYLKYELSNYLTGRAAEKGMEQPLRAVERQAYIHSNKASLVFYALQDYIGEEALNAAIRSYRKDWVFHAAPYPAFADLIGHIRKVTPDSLQYLIHDLFETVTMFENRAEGVLYEQTVDGNFEVTINVVSQKFRVDSTGRDEAIPLDDWIDIGIYTESVDGKEKLTYLLKHHITQRDNTFTLILGAKPTRAGIDPLHKLIDKHAADNTLLARQLIEIGNLPVH